MPRLTPASAPSPTSRARTKQEMLQQVEPDERKEKLETTFDALCESYRDLLERADLDI